MKEWSHEAWAEKKEVTDGTGLRRGAGPPGLRTQQRLRESTEAPAWIHSASWGLGEGPRWAGCSEQLLW